MWSIKLKAPNEQTEENKQKLIDIDISMPVTRRKGELRVSKGGQIYSDKRRFGFGWWVHNAIYRWCIIELYT